MILGCSLHILETWWMKINAVRGWSELGEDGEMLKMIRKKISGPGLAHRGIWCWPSLDL